MYFDISLFKKTIRLTFPILCGVLASLLSTTAVVLIDNGIEFINPRPIENLHNLNSVEITETIFGAIFISPIVETLLCQVLIIENINKFDETSRRQACLISTAIFSFVHIFVGGWRQALCMIALGAILANLYLRLRKTSLGSAFVATLVAHCTHNSFNIFLSWHYPGAI
jgi:membrane protease YdiL (CAAX protease family)